MKRKNNWQRDLSPDRLAVRKGEIVWSVEDAKSHLDIKKKT